MQYEVISYSANYDISNYDLEFFKEQVNEYINDGYIPQGGLSTVTLENSTGTKTIYLLQAMIKLDRNDKSFVSKSDITWENE